MASSPGWKLPVRCAWRSPWKMRCATRTWRSTLCRMSWSPSWRFSALLDRMAPPRTILCTPTNALSITDLASCTYRAGLCVGLAGRVVCGAGGGGAQPVCRGCGAGVRGRDAGADGCGIQRGRGPRGADAGEESGWLDASTSPSPRFRVNTAAERT